MKWLILFALIASCGKHQEPGSKDLRNSDGDAWLNYEDVDLNVANFESIGEVKGVLRFKTNTINELQFGNIQENLDSKVTNLIISNEKRFKKEEHFSEWSKLKILKPVPLAKMDKLQYEINLQFEKTSEEVQYIYFESKKFSFLVGEWKQNMTFELPADNLAQLAAGDAHFILRQISRKTKWFKGDIYESIKGRTNRVLIDDGKSTQVYYISKEMDLEGIFKWKGYSGTLISSEDDFFYDAKKLGKIEWIGREFSNGDKVILYTDMEKLKSRFFANYMYQKVKVYRENGIPQKGLNLSNKQDANVYLRVKPLNQSERTFTEKKYEKVYHEHQSQPKTCRHHERGIETERSYTPDLNTLVENTPLMQNPEVFNGALTVNAQPGDFWEMKLNSMPQNGVIELSPTAAKNKVKIGLLSGNCGEKSGTIIQSDYEGILSYEIESYVEKMP